jgi:hypothetical protein
MPFVEPNHVGNDVPVAAFGVHEHPRSAGFRLDALPATPFRPETGVPHVAGFSVDDIALRACVVYWRAAEPAVGCAGDARACRDS